jgi:ribose transport system ATP-binding protein
MTRNKDKLIMKEISKAFPGVKALDKVSFEVISGEVHSLIGQNGAGKSTLMGILNGITHPDEGEIFINNKVVIIDDPNDAFNLNLSIVHQEFALCNNSTVAENIFLGNEPYNKYGIIDYNLMNKKAEELLKSININLDTNQIVGNLNTSQWQIIEICKALAKEPKFIVMDEPTASLDETQIENLFLIINTLKNNGIGIIYISHKLNEIIEISDRITVLKDGKVKKTFEKNNVNENLLVQTMVGEKIKNGNKANNVFKKNENYLEITNLSYLNTFKDINISLKKGEILGLSGLLGSGANEILRCIFGIIQQNSGEIVLDKKNIKIQNPNDAVSFGIGYIPADRKNEGLIQENSVRNNCILTIFKELTNFNFFNSSKANLLTNEYINKLDIRVTDTNTYVKNLSGGNQQKVVIAKWLAKKCKVLLFDEPTRGIDVAAKAQIWSLIKDFARAGGSVIVASNEIPELISGCNKIITMQKTKIVETFTQENFNEERISLSISTN